MAIIQDPITLVKQKVTTEGASRHALYPRQAEFYQLGMLSPTYTGFAAGSGTAGHIFAFRWGSTTHLAVIQRIVAKRRVIVGPTAAQEWGSALYRLTGYTASHTGGTEATKTGTNNKKDTNSNTTRVTSAMMTSGSALTAGTHTLDTQPLDVDFSWELAAAATVQKTFHTLLVESYEASQGAPLILRQDQGILLRNEILMGAAMSIRSMVQIHWAEVPIADL